jgi:hypothetical protein
MPIAVLQITLEYTPSITTARKAYASEIGGRSGGRASGCGGVDDVDDL